jgi:hypothetical protein
MELEISVGIASVKKIVDSNVTCLVISNHEYLFRIASSLFAGISMP